MASSKEVFKGNTRKSILLLNPAQVLVQVKLHGGAELYKSHGITKLRHLQELRHVQALL
jgi:hypothetical protein